MGHESLATPVRLTLFRLLLWLLAALPLPANRALGSGLGRLLGILPNPLRDTTRANLARCLPDLAPAERDRLTRANLREVGRAITETGPLWRWPPQRVLSLIRRVDGRDHIDRALARGKGVILATPHLGAWEAAGLWTAAHYPITTLYRRPRRPELDAPIRAARERLGTRYLPADPGGIRSLYRELNENRVVGLLPDQAPAGSGYLMAPFFGQPAATMTLLARLARRSGAPVIFIFCERLPGSEGYHLHCRPPLEEIHNGELAQSIAAMNREVEACIRILPAQYQWGYRRFKRTGDGTQPTG